MSGNKLYIREHLDYFDAKDSYPLSEFLSFEEEMEQVLIECSCKVSGQKVDAKRFNLWFPNPHKKKQLNKMMVLFETMARNDNILFNRDLFTQFYNDQFDWSKVKQFILGVDIREELPSSRLKIWFIIEDYPEKIETAIHLYGENKDLRSLTLHDELLIGFDFYFNGRNVVKVYPDVKRYEYEQEAIQKNIGKVLHPSAMRLMEKSEWVHISFSRNYSSKVLHFHVHDPVPFLEMISGERARTMCNYYRQRELHNVVVSFYEHELIEQNIINWNFYYMPGLPIRKSSILNWMHQ
ncbi:MAG: LynF/TruF/PatF family peptide O-prenyltransferase [Leptospirales bacterium]